jgi:hypothetical protein
MSKLRRDDLAQFFASNPRLMRAFEDQSEVVETVSAGIEGTQALKDATVIVLSANGDFTNERVLEVADGIKITVTADKVKLTLSNVARTADHKATFVPPADVLLFLPPEGTLLSDVSLASAPIFAGLTPYANDAAAASGGVPVRGAYINSSTGAVTARLV